MSKEQHVATHDLITANGLNYSLAEFPTTGTLCIRNQCNVAVVKAEDTCRTIAAANSLSQAELHSWNPFINGLCNNIEDFVGQTICLSNPLGDYLVSNNTNAGGYTTPAPIPADIAPNTTTNCGLFHETLGGEDCAILGLQYSISFADLQFLNPMIWDNCTNLWLDTSYCVAPVGDITSYPGYPSSSPTFTISPQASTPIPFFDPFAVDNSTGEGGDIIIPLAVDTRTDCWDYIWWNESLGVPISCWDLAASADITGEMFILWNPSLDQNDNNASTPTYDYPCTVSASSSYCVAVASPTPTPSATVTPPSPRGAGEIEGCTQWFQAVLSCAAHLDALRMPIATLYQYNPSVGADCLGFVLGTYYCWSTSLDGSVPDDGSGAGGGVSSSSTVATSTVPTTTTSPGVTTPTPTQTGMVAGCTEFYPVAAGDGCWAIANEHGISLDDFYAWNPAVGTDCGFLWPTYYVCVGVSSSPGPTGTTAALPTSVSTSTSAEATPTGKVSTDGTCAGTAGMTCAGSAFGDCCSSSGFCGSTTAYCGAGCQAEFGTCTAGSGDISEDGICGTNSKTCKGSLFGDCCSSSGYCGSSSDYCGTGCQASYGACT